MVFVLGESLNAKNMQINGYKRPTTPYLMKEKNVVSLPHIYSEYGYTHESVPYILTRASHKAPDLGYKERSFISILKKAGYQTTWLANQESIVTYSYFMNECQYMKMNTLLKIYNCLKYEWPSVEVDPTIAKDAVKPIERMLELS